MSNNILCIKTVYMKVRQIALQSTDLCSIRRQGLLLRHLQTCSRHDASRGRRELDPRGREDVGLRRRV